MSASDGGELNANAEGVTSSLGHTETGIPVVVSATELVRNTISIPLIDTPAVDIILSPLNDTISTPLIDTPTVDTILSPRTDTISTPLTDTISSRLIYPISAPLIGTSAVGTGSSPLTNTISNHAISTTSGHPIDIEVSHRGSGIAELPVKGDGLGKEDPAEGNTVGNWTAPQAYDYNTYLAARDPRAPRNTPHGDWLSSAVRYEWKDDYGDVAPRLEKLERVLFNLDDDEPQGAGIDFSRCVCSAVDIPSSSHFARGKPDR